MIQVNRFQMMERLNLSLVKYSPSNYVPASMRNNPFYKWLWRKVHFYGEDCVIGVSGPTGYGKTTLSIALSEKFDIDSHLKSRFPIRENMEVDGVKKEVLVPRLVNSLSAYKDLRKKVNYPIGTAFVVDEAQVLVNSRDFMSSKNKDVIRLLSTGRIFRSYTFLNLPYWYNLDSQIKNYLHAVIIVDRPDRSKGISNWTPYLIKPVGVGKPPWTIRFRSRDKFSHRIRVLKKVHSYLPSPELNVAQQLKTTQWKELLHQGKIDSSGEVISLQEPKQGTKVKKLLQHKLEDGLYWFNRIKLKRSFFFNERKMSYNTSQLFRTVTVQMGPEDPSWSKEICEIVISKFIELDEEERKKSAISEVV